VLLVAPLLHKHDTTLAGGHAFVLVSYLPIGSLAFFVAVHGDLAEGTVFGVLDGLGTIIAGRKGVGWGHVGGG